ncbi:MULTISPECIES: hypothetical protein [unclassified Bacillus (in: firmicutes)]|uniref:hypothetical protein n=1 Tax=unclassified Bacillus (in: firmicutes) TaxID=185979 RepID=UPI0008DF4434|nr:MULTISPECIES: hypothetical protein [unclassified Bacillus (in: firmicutes)]SFA86459.1 hypothetical protein SAMN02799634_102127 [Bacillus sp. UNCCL13]SFQ83709.1 hypothetical protein SAMN04488577_2248 [Bacillus sp. cl95]
MVLLDILKDPFFETRYKAVLKIPPTENDLFKTIMIILNKINDCKELSLDDFETWFYSNYSMSKNRCYNTWKTLERANLIRKTPKKGLALTIDGEKCISLVDIEKIKINIMKNFSDSFIGIFEFLYLCSSYNSGTRQQRQHYLFQTWYSNYESSFDTKRSLKSSKHQFDIIKLYLESLGMIQLQSGLLIPNIHMINKILDNYQ